MKKAMLAIAVFINLFTLSFVTHATAYAAVAAGCDKSSFVLGLPTWYKYLDVGPKDGDPCAVKLPVDDEKNVDFALTAGRIGLAVIEILLRFAGIISVVFVMYGGINYMLSEGDPEKAKKARGTIFNALIGLLVALVATAVVNFVGGSLIK